MIERIILLSNLQKKDVVSSFNIYSKFYITIFSGIIFFKEVL